MKPEIFFIPDGRPSGGLEPVITPAAEAAIAAHPEYVFNAYQPATPAQLADPDNAPFISIPPGQQPLISVHAPGLSPKG